MVTIHFFVIMFLSFLCFSLGRLAGRMESSILMSRRLNCIMLALKKVETISSLKGENLANVSSEELVKRINKQLELEDDQS
jgi:hypothetical protein